MGTSIVSAHADTTRKDIHTLVGELNEHLGTVVVQALTGTKDRGRPLEWARPDGAAPRAAAEQQLRLAHRVWSYLSDHEGNNVALSWFVGSNPLLEEATPVTAIREGLPTQVVRAARAFVEGSAAS